jgi:Uma2 family endonuclease
MKGKPPRKAVLRPAALWRMIAFMGLPAEKPRAATYADLESVPPNKVAEIIHGVLHVFPRPAIPHARASSMLTIELGGPFSRGRNGPGGWHFLDEPELHFGPKDDEDVLVPDIAAFCVERMPRFPKTAYITLAPDWVCEILSPGTEATDRAEKMPIYAREGVQHVWLVHPIRRTLEVFQLDEKSRWIVLAVHQGAKCVRAEPFAALELDLRLLWPDDDEPAGGEKDENVEGEATPTLPAPKSKKAPAKARKRATK